LIGLRVATDRDSQIVLINRLGDLPSLRARPMLEDMAVKEKDLLTLGALNRSIALIRNYEGLVNIFDILKSSLSTGSILILMALGLAITFGMMGVINMAHGEMMMIGAYTTYIVQLAFGHTAEHPAPLFFLFALPMSFLVAALVGGVIEWLVVRHLYKKPIESLLATYGVSLILTQVIRLTFGDNRATNTPDWLQGAVEVAQGMDIPAYRFFILLVAIFSVLLVLFIFRYTKVGLNMKATMQNRDMAASMGINTRWIDSFTFMLGSGIAGIAGYALTTVGGITPDMGKNYIVDSFLIVVTGGTGSIAGVVVSGAGIGFLNKFLEGTLFGTVWAKIVVLALVMTFIQFRPSGIFAPKGRLADE
jgi:urea transport system permease protein